MGPVGFVRTLGSQSPRFLKNFSLQSRIAVGCRQIASTKEEDPVSEFNEELEHIFGSRPEAGGFGSSFFSVPEASSPKSGTATKKMEASANLGFDNASVASMHAMRSTSGHGPSFQQKRWQSATEGVRPPATEHIL
mmetsp:Transcript_27/g.31  ORF Transcript_27/g.31 Transcript_27/m.31 type:complete len:136 (-) Transcript_27:1412-1819(-)